MSRRYSASELVDDCAALGAMPEIYFRVRKVIDDPATTVSAVAGGISTDPALTARVLRAVNSPLFGLSGKIETVMRAVTVLGTQTVHDLVLAASVTGAFTAAPNSTFTQKSVTCATHCRLHHRAPKLGMCRLNWRLLSNMRQFWRMSLLTGLTARALSKECGLIDAERPFVEGLLSRVGMMIMAERIGSLIAAVARHAVSTGTARHASESAFIGCNYAQAGAELLRRWHLPDSITSAIERHPQPGRDDPVDVPILHAAALIAARYETGPVSRQREVAIDADILSWLGLDGYAVQAAGESAIAELAATEEVMFPASKAA